MAVTDVQAVRFCNEYARTRADQFAQTYYRTRIAINKWDAEGIAALIPNSASEIIVDGAETDGRAIITGQMVHQLMESYARPWMTDLDANTALKLNILLRLAVNPER